MKADIQQALNSTLQGFDFIMLGFQSSTEKYKYLRFNKRANSFGANHRIRSA